MRMDDLRALLVAGVVGLAVAPFAVAVIEPAFAGNHKQDGNGAGNGNGNGGDENGPGNSENAPGHDDDGPGNSENAPGRADSGDDDRDGDNVARELGHLNAAHASELAFLNADPDSMVGRINSYREELVALEAVRAEVMVAQDAYSDAVERYDGRESTEIEADIVALDPEAAGYDEALERLNAELASALAHEAELRDLADQLAAAQDRLATAESEEDEALLALTGGEVLSDEAYRELLRLLGM